MPAVSANRNKKFGCWGETESRSISFWKRSHAQKPLTVGQGFATCKCIVCMNFTLNALLVFLPWLWMTKVTKIVRIFISWYLINDPYATIHHFLHKSCFIFYVKYLFYPHDSWTQMVITQYVQYRQSENWTLIKDLRNTKINLSIAADEVTWGCDVMSLLPAETRLG